MIYDQFSVIKVPFPFTDKNASKRRPAVVVSNSSYQRKHSHCILCMITSAKESHWSDDIQILNFEKAGLSVSSVVRMKLFSLDERLIIEKIGVLDWHEIAQLSQQLKDYFANEGDPIVVEHN